MSTSRSNDLSRTWSKTTFTIQNNEENVDFARKILENKENWKNPYSYAEFKGRIPNLTKEQMVRLIEQDLDLPEANKMFKIIKGRRLQQLLLGADVMQLGGRKTQKRRSRNRRIRHRRSKSRRNRIL
jgi:hypothetical protein